MDDSPWGHKDSETEQQQYLLKAGKSHTTKIIGLRAPTQCKKGRYTTRKDERKKKIRMDLHPWERAMKDARFSHPETPVTRLKRSLRG